MCFPYPSPFHPIVPTLATTALATPDLLPVTPPRERACHMTATPFFQPPRLAWGVLVTPSPSSWPVLVTPPSTRACCSTVAPVAQLPRPTFRGSLLPPYPPTWLTLGASLTLPLLMLAPGGCHVSTFLLTPPGRGQHLIMTPLSACPTTPLHIYPVNYIRMEAVLSASTIPAVSFTTGSTTACPLMHTVPRDSPCDRHYHTVPALSCTCAHTPPLTTHSTLMMSLLGTLPLAPAAVIIPIITGIRVRTPIHVAYMLRVPTPHLAHSAITLGLPITRSLILIHVSLSIAPPFSARARAPRATTDDAYRRVIVAWSFPILIPATVVIIIPIIAVSGAATHASPCSRLFAPALPTRPPSASTTLYRPAGIALPCTISPVRIALILQLMRTTSVM